MRIIIAGSRDFTNYNFLKAKCFAILSQYQKEKPFEIVSGTANGADKLGEQFAEEMKLKISRFPAQWATEGKKAGYLRNIDMADYAKKDNGILIAFRVNYSKGTTHMISIAKKYGLISYVYEV
jgi:hypothetical protein